MAQSSQILFHVPFSGKVDKENHIIHGVSLITGDIEAEGHDLHVDDTTLGQIHTCASGRKQITVKADHKGSDGKTFQAIVGYLTNFRTEGKKVRGDLQLLETEPLTPKIEEMAERMPQNFGLSVAFKGKGSKGAGGKQFARCERLISVDLVETPAANPDGLFGQPAADSTGDLNRQVDSSFVDMGNTNTDPNNSGAEPTLREVLDAVQAQNQQIAALSQRIEAQEQTNQQLSQLLNEPDLAELGNMTDEQLAEAGFDVAAVREAVDAAIASGELVSGEGDGAGGDGPGTNPAGVGADAPAGDLAATTAGAALSVARQAQKEVHQFRAQMAAAAQAEEQAGVEHAFTVIEAKVEALAETNEQLTTALAAKDAEIKSLRSALKTGGRGVAPGVEAVTLFNAKGAYAPTGSFEQLCTVKFEELKAQPNMTLTKAKAEAVAFCIRHHTEEYSEYRERGSKLQL